MTMTFQVKDSVLLQDLKLRDEIRFQVKDLGDGEFRVEALEIIKPWRNKVKVIINFHVKYA